MQEIKNEERALVFGERPYETSSHDEHLLSDKIIEVAKQHAFVASQTNIFQTNGYYRYIADLGNSPAKTYAEQAPVATSDPNIIEIKMFQSRLASAIEASKEAMEKGPQIKNHIFNLLANRIILGLEDYMFNLEDSTANIQNILLHNSKTNLAYVNRKIEDIFVKTSVSATSVTYQELFDSYNQFAKQPENLDGAVWVVEDIAKLSSIVDGAGSSILKFDNLPAGAVGRVFGIPVFKTAKFTEGQKAVAVLINPKKAYAVSIAKKAEMKKIAGDTIQELKGASVFLGEIYAGGRVVNPRAIVIVKTA